MVTLFSCALGLWSKCFKQVKQPRTISFQVFPVLFSGRENVQGRSASMPYVIFMESH